MARNLINTPQTPIDIHPNSLVHAPQIRYMHCFAIAQIFMTMRSPMAAGKIDCGTPYLAPVEEMAEEKCSALDLDQAGSFRHFHALRLLHSGCDIQYLTRIQSHQERSLQKAHHSLDLSSAKSSGYSGVALPYHLPAEGIFLAYWFSGKYVDRVEPHQKSIAYMSKR